MRISDWSSDVCSSDLQDLVDSGTLGAVRGEAREFKRDAVFSSPSAAAAVVWGRSANGRTSWVVKETGQSLAEWEQGIPAGPLVDDDDADGHREAFYSRLRDQVLQIGRAHLCTPVNNAQYV